MHQQFVILKNGNNYDYTYQNEVSYIILDKILLLLSSCWNEIKIYDIKLHEVKLSGRFVKDSTRPARLLERVVDYPARDVK